ncbi:MAG: toll/interleukin-1 receptor domain-containing protein [Gammaproteobacteria bacterium]
MNPIELFISHSERDEELVRPLAEWLQDGLGLTEEQVRCTVITNMDVGGLPAEVLRHDIQQAKVLLGLLTTNSLHSAWAQLEMGAGWLRQSLRTIRGPGIDASDLPSPHRDFTTVGYCDKWEMHNLLGQIGVVLGRSVKDGSEEKLDQIIDAAQQRLLQGRANWFSLPPLASAYRFDENRYDYSLRTVCSSLGLSPEEAKACTTSLGVLTSDPEQVPAWAEDLWTISKNAVNFMLDHPSGGSESDLDVPPGVLTDRLISDLKHALDSRRKNRETLARNWFRDAKEWILANPPSPNRSHGAHGHLRR